MWTKIVYIVSSSSSQIEMCAETVVATGSSEGNIFLDFIRVLKMFSFPKLRDYLLQSALCFVPSPSEIKQLFTH